MSYDHFDIHSHLYFPDYDNDREEEIEKIKKANIGTITIGTSFDTSKKALELASAHENIFACVGQHPGDPENLSFDERVSLLTKEKKVVAVGECGLDYFRLSGDDLEQNEIKRAQKEVFEKQISLAVGSGLPLMLHIRPSRNSNDAYNDALEILESFAVTSGEKLKGNSHFFAGDVETLKRFLQIGFTVSFTGVITFTRDYDEHVKYVPSDMVMSETDSPFVSPVPHRRERNSPLYVPSVVQKMAEIRGEDVRVINMAILANVKRVFKIG